MANPQIVVEYIADTAPMVKGMQDQGRQMGRAGQLAQKAFLPAVGALGALAVAGQKAVESASALNEQVSASTILFGKHAKGMQRWAKTGADAFGLSATEALQAANQYGNMFTTVGLGVKDTASMSKAMVQLAGDMASFHDADPSDMLQNLRSGLSGESEPLRKYGVLLSEARVKQFAYAEGIAKNGQELTEAQKVQARYGVIMQDTAKAQGDFARTGDSVANQQRTIAAETENTSAALGQALLPVMQTLLQLILPIVEFMGRYPKVFTAVAIAVGVLAAGIVILNAALAVTAAVSASILLPVLAVVAALVAVVAVGILIYKNWDKIKRTADRAWKAIKDAVAGVLAWIKTNWPKIIAVMVGPIGIAAVLIIGNWDKIKRAAKGVVDAIKGVWSGLVDFFRGIKDKILGVFEAVGRGIANALKAPVNAVIDAWNRLAIPAFGVKINLPGPAPDVDFRFGGYQFPDIPRLAQGGIVTQPTIAMLGESGPEAVLPLGNAGIQVRVFIGDTELRGIVSQEVSRTDTATARFLLAGRG